MGWLSATVRSPHSSMTRTEVTQLIAMGYIKRLRHSQHFVITERGQEALVTTEDK
jgi:hypothetical protein